MNTQEMPAIEALKECFKPGKSALIYGIGNPSRQDDGLGIRLIEKLEALELPAGVQLEANYQLNVEDALFLSQYDSVLFVDATGETLEDVPYKLYPVEPCQEISFSTHAMSFGSVLGLCDKLYHKFPNAYVLAIAGHEWNICDGLSEKAAENLEDAYKLLMELGRGTL